MLMNLHFLKRYKKAQISLGYAKIDSNQTTISAKLPFCSNQCLRSLERFLASNLSNNPAVKCASSKFKGAASLNVFQHVNIRLY